MRIVVAGWVLLVFAAGVGWCDEPAGETERVRALVAEVRGLPWKREVQVVPAQGPAPNPRWSGFYTWGTDRITLVERNPLTRPLLLAHELAHALQDQHYDLTQVERAAGGSDAQLALKAAIEGEAHLVAIAYALRRLGFRRAVTTDDLPDLGRASLAASVLAQALGIRHPPEGTPPPARDGFLFPYTHGLAFAQAVVRARGRGLAGLNGVLLDPPRSTEQVLHPGKYLSAERDEPVAVALPAAPAGAGWRQGATGTLGEWGVRAELAAHLPAARAATAAAGWGGDTFAVYRKGRREVRRWSTVWDTERDAQEFVAAYQEVSGDAGVEVRGRRVEVREEREGPESHDGRSARGQAEEL